MAFAFAISALVHAVLPWWLYSTTNSAVERTASKVSPPPTSIVSEQTPVSVELLDNQVVESEVAGKGEAPKDSRFLGQRNQTVEEATRAPNRGNFSAGKGDSGATSDTHGKKGSPGGDLNKVSMKDLMGRDVARAEEDQSSERMPSNDDHLVGVRMGQHTLLSTRETLYFSFFQRIKVVLKAEWEKELSERMQSDEAKRLASRQTRWTTRVLAVVSSDGTVQQVTVARASGYPEMDEAAANAFRRLARLHNPPQGLLRKDGLMHLPWEFTVEVKALLPAIAISDDDLDRWRRVD